MRKILITGGPSTGKTILVNELEKLGFNCFKEISREITKEWKKKGIDQFFLTDPIAFSKILYEGRLNQYKSAKFDNENYVFDRGPIDVIAYLNFKNVTYNSELFKSSSELNYDFSFILPPWEEIYTNDLERYESFEECERINQNLVKTYMENKINLIEVPKFSVKERVNFINEFLSNE